MSPLDGSDPPLAPFCPAQTGGQAVPGQAGDRHQHLQTVSEHLAFPKGKEPWRWGSGLDTPGRHPSLAPGASGTSVPAVTHGQALLTRPPLGAGALRSRNALPCHEPLPPHRGPSVLLPQQTCICPSVHLSVTEQMALGAPASPHPRKGPPQRRGTAPGRRGVQGAGGAEAREPEALATSCRSGSAWRTRRGS